MAVNKHRNIFYFLGDWWAQRQAHTEAPKPTQPGKSARRLIRWLMPNGGTLLLVLGLLLAQQVWASPMARTSSAPGPSATTVNYQGRLADSSGNPVADGNYSMSFALYDAPSGGNLVWGPETHGAVPVSGGLFSVGLGSQTSGGVPTNVWDGDRYLEVTVGGETLSPRELIRSVPIAGMALTASNVPDKTITNQKLALSYWYANGGTVVSSISGDSPDEVISLDVEFPTDGTYLIFAKVISWSDEADKQLMAEIWDENGKINPHAQIANTHPVAGPGGRQTGSITSIVPFSAGIHTIKLVAYMNTGSVGNVGSHSELTVIPLGQP